MVKIQVRHDVQGAVDYFLGDPQLDAEEKQGLWIGDGCEQAGLVAGSSVSAADFQSMLEGVTPAGRNLFLTKKLNRRAAWDAVVTPHKSISIAALCLASDVSSKVLEAFKAAVMRLFAHMESLSYRKPSVPSDALVPEKNLVAACFVHQSSRHADPHLHAHLLLMNAVHCSDRRWRSLEPAPLYRHQTALKFVFNSHLLEELLKRGLKASRNAFDGLTAVLIPKEVCDAHSKAHNAIVGLADEILRSGFIPEPWIRLPKAALISRLNERTRPRKRPVKPEWRELLSATEKKHFSTLLVGDAPSCPSPPLRASKQKTKPDPLGILREKWAAFDRAKRSVKRVVAVSASEFPEILLGDFSRSAAELRSEFGEEGAPVASRPQKRKKVVVTKTQRTDEIRQRTIRQAAMKAVRGRSKAKPKPKV